MIKNFLKNNPIHKKIVPIFDILFLCNPTLLFFIWLLVTIGIYLSNFMFDHIPLFETTFSIYTLLFFIAITFFFISLLLMNDLFREGNKFYIKEICLLWC